MVSPGRRIIEPGWTLRSYVGDEQGRWKHTSASAEGAKPFTIRVFGERQSWAPSSGSEVEPQPPTHSQSISFLLSLTSWVARRCPGLYNSPLSPAPPPPPPALRHQRFFRWWLAPGKASGKISLHWLQCPRMDNCSAVHPWVLVD